MSAIRLELINLLKSCDTRIYSPLLHKLLFMMGDNKISDLDISKTMLKIIIENEKQKLNTKG